MKKARIWIMKLASSAAMKRILVLACLISISILVLSACDSDAEQITLLQHMQQINYGYDITVIDINLDGYQSHLSPEQIVFLHRIEIVRLIIIGELENIVDLVMTVVDVDTNVDVFAEVRPDEDFIISSDVRVLVTVATENNDPLSSIDEELIVNKVLWYFYGLQRENVHIEQNQSLV